MPELICNLDDYAGRALDVENLIFEKMSQLSTEEFEAVVRPVFKDDEPMMVAIGAVLGLLVGELQVVAVEHLSRQSSSRRGDVRHLRGTGGGNTPAGWLD